MGSWSYASFYKKLKESTANATGPEKAKAMQFARQQRSGLMSSQRQKIAKQGEDIVTLEDLLNERFKRIQEQNKKLKERAAKELPETPATDYYQMQDIDTSVDISDAQTSMAEQASEAAISVDIPDYKVYNSPDEMSELEILARTIEAEAGVESFKGKIAVGAVVANRASSGNYGQGIKGVILKKGQFSPWNSWTGYAKGEQGREMLELQPSEDSYKAAQAILTGNYTDATGGATHYVDPSVSQPGWLPKMKGRKRGTVTIGSHLFGNADNNKTYDGRSWISKRSGK